MNHKLLIIVISGLATVGSLFLFIGKPEQQISKIVEAMTTPNPVGFDLGSSKRSNLGKTSVTPTHAIQESSLYTSSPSPTSTSHLATPLLSSSPSTTPTLLIPTPQQTSPPVPTGNSQQTLPSPSVTPQQSAKININTANQQELEKITGVGPTIAQRIIEYRNKNGPFQTIEDLKKVNGIGDKNFEKMKNEITI